MNKEKENLNNETPQNSGEEHDTELSDIESAGTGIADAAAGPELADEAGEITALEKLQQELVEARDALLRERAEFANYRKRAAAERVQAEASAMSRIMNDLLPALDALDQVHSGGFEELRAREDVRINAFLDGFDLIRRQLSSGFEKNGVDIIDPVNSAFDPNEMEAIAMLEGDVESEIVTSVYQKGYRIGGRLIRPARVAVTRPAPKAQSGEETEQPG